MSADNGALVNAYVDKLTQELMENMRGKVLLSARVEMLESRCRDLELARDSALVEAQATVASEMDGLRAQLTRERDTRHSAQRELDQLKREELESLRAENSRITAALANAHATLELMRAGDPASAAPELAPREPEKITRRKKRGEPDTSQA